MIVITQGNSSAGDPVQVTGDLQKQLDQLSHWDGKRLAAVLRNDLARE